jgi:tetratricopeptide (TPR) repeat protein
VPEKQQRWSLTYGPRFRSICFAAFNREVRTVQRWEEREGMPVRRHRHAKLGSVYAFRSELKSWWEGRANSVAATVPAPLRRVTAAPAPRAATRRAGIVVLPFSSCNAMESRKLDADRLAEEIGCHLGRLDPQHVGVFSRRHTKIYSTLRGEECFPVASHPSLFLLEGSLRHCAGRARIYVQLVSVVDLCSIWSAVQDFEMLSDPSIEENIAAWVAAVLPADLLRNLAAVPSHSIASSDDIEEACDHGDRLLEQRTPGSVRRAVQEFERTLRIDSTCTRAYSGLTQCYSLMSFYSIEQPKTVGAMARSAALRGLSVRPERAETHASLGDVQFGFDWDWQGAEAHYLTALALNPHYDHAHAWYAGLLWALGRFDDASAHLLDALDRNPDSLSLNLNLAELFYYSGSYNDAVRQSRRLTELDSSFVPGFALLGLAYEQTQDYEAAMTAFREAIAVAGGDAGLLAMLAHCYAVCGEEAKARTTVQEVLREGRGGILPNYDLAAALAALGERDESLACLRRAWETRSMKLTNVRFDPRMAPLHGTGAFDDLMRRMRFSD